jgi:hypothetical protein
LYIFPKRATQISLSSPIFLGIGRLNDGCVVRAAPSTPTTLPEKLAVIAAVVVVVVVVVVAAAAAAVVGTESKIEMGRVRLTLGFCNEKQDSIISLMEKSSESSILGNSSFLILFVGWGGGSVELEVADAPINDSSALFLQRPGLALHSSRQGALSSSSLSKNIYKYIYNEIFIFPDLLTYMHISFTVNVYIFHADYIYNIPHNVYFDTDLPFCFLYVCFGCGWFCRQELQKEQEATSLYWKKPPM